MVNEQAKFFVYWLDTNKHDTAIKWIEQLRQALGMRNQNVVELSGKRAALALWNGFPFICVGNRASIGRFIDQCTVGGATGIFHDHAYFWCLSNCDQAEYLQSRWMDFGKREVVLNWCHMQQDLVLTEIDLMQRYRSWVGLSYASRIVRQEITRIALGPKGPWTPTLIIGETGVGKEIVVHALHAESERRDQELGSVSCSWFTDELLLSQLLGTTPGAYTGADRKEKPGLLATHENGVLFFDDVDSAPNNVQGTLLRINTTARGQRAKFTPLGASRESSTNAWLIFATNSRIDQLLERRVWRKDFLYRFEDRVITVQPLRSRVADIPAIAKLIWQELIIDIFKLDPQLNENMFEDYLQRLSDSTLKWLCDQCLSYQGNVLALRTLLSLAASAAKSPAYNQRSIRQILSTILQRGPDYLHWVNITAPSNNAAVHSNTDTRLNEIRKLDSDDDCSGGVDAPRWVSSDSAKSEQQANKILNTIRMDEVVNPLEEFLRLLDNETRSKNSNTRFSVRLSRLICFLDAHVTITKSMAAQLCMVGATTASADLDKLCNAGFISCSTNQRVKTWVKNW